MRICNVLDIYEYHVDKLLRENPDYVGVKYRINNGLFARAVFSLGEKMSPESMMRLRRKLVNVLINSDYSNAKERNKLMNQLKSVEEDLRMINKGEEVGNPYNKIIDFESFKLILYAHNKEVEKRILNGENYNMGSSLGFISIRRVARNPERLTVNWEESYKRKAKLLEEGKELFSKENPEGEKWLIYWTDDYWWRVGWDKSHKIKNETVYEFKPCGGTTLPGYRENPKGLRLKMSKAVREDETLLFKVKYYNYRKE